MLAPAPQTHRSDDQRSGGGGGERPPLTDDGFDPQRADLLVDFSKDVGHLNERSALMLLLGAHL
jgi:hypothetical protein